MNGAPFDAIARVLPETTLLVDGEGRILALNPAAAQLLQRSRDALIGRRLADLVAEPADKVEAYLQACAASAHLLPGSLSWPLPGDGVLACRAEGAAVRPRTDDAPALLLLRLRPESDAVSQFVLLNAKIDELNREILLRRSVEDDLRRLNERLEAEVARRTQELAATNQELRRSNQDLQEFAYVASHDLQEPLRKVKAFMDLLLQEAGEHLNEPARLYAGRVQEAAGRMTTLIRDLLQLSRVRTQTQPLQRVDLQTVVREVLGDLEAALRRTDGRVEVGDLPVIDADPTQMRQLFQNLIGNALKFHRPGVPPVVRVTATTTPEGGPSATTPTLVLCIEDNGIGFEPQYADQIFKPFQRLHGRESYEGTGMGLAICRRIAERHGGTILAQSAPDQGSTFEIRLPLRPPAPAQQDR